MESQAEDRRLVNFLARVDTLTVIYNVADVLDHEASLLRDEPDELLVGLAPRPWFSTKTAATNVLGTEVCGSPGRPICPR